MRKKKRERTNTVIKKSDKKRGTKYTKTITTSTDVKVKGGVAMATIAGTAVVLKSLFESNPDLVSNLLLRGRKSNRNRYQILTCEDFIKLEDATIPLLSDNEDGRWYKEESHGRAE